MTGPGMIPATWRGARRDHLPSEPVTILAFLPVAGYHAVDDYGRDHYHPSGVRAIVADAAGTLHLIPLDALTVRAP